MEFELAKKLEDMSNHELIAVLMKFMMEDHDAFMKFKELVDDQL